MPDERQPDAAPAIYAGRYVTSYTTAVLDDPLGWLSALGTGSFVALRNEHPARYDLTCKRSFLRLRGVMRFQGQLRVKALALKPEPEHNRSAGKRAARADLAAPAPVQAAIASGKQRARVHPKNHAPATSC